MDLHSNGIVMYIIEKIIRLLSKFQNKKTALPLKTDRQDFEAEDILTCSHIFMPVDSSNKIFGCTKCGYLVTKSRLTKSKIKKKD